MSWLEIAASFPRIENKDLIRFKLSYEEESSMLDQFNRAIIQMANDSADIAIITLRKILIKYPEWAEAILLYGLCLAIEGHFKRAYAAFEHALNLGLRKEELVYLAQTCHQMASESLNNSRQKAESSSKSKAPISFSKSNPLIQEDDEIRPRKHMQAPILMKAPRRPDRARLASDRERRELLMKATSSNGEIPDDDIDVSIPRTPAEKLRIIIALVLAAVVFLGLVFLFVRVIFPFFSGLSDVEEERARLDYLQQALYERADDPDIAQIIENYESEFAGSNTQESSIDDSDSSVSSESEEDIHTDTDSTEVIDSEAIESLVSSEDQVTDDV